MDRSKHLVRSGDGDRATLDPFAIGTVPAFPETRKGKWLIACDGDEIRLLPAGWRLCPFVEAVGDDEAAALLEGVAESGLLGDRLGARVDHLVAARDVLRPERHQAPAQQQ